MNDVDYDTLAAAVAREPMHHHRADRLSAVVKGAAPGTCTVTPTAVAGGKTITGSPVQITVTLPVATQLVVTVGAVGPQTAQAK